MFVSVLFLVYGGVSLLTALEPDLSPMPPPPRSPGASAPELCTERQRCLICTSEEVALNIEIDPRGISCVRILAPCRRRAALVEKYFAALRITCTGMDEPLVTRRPPLAPPPSLEPDLPEDSSGMVWYEVIGIVISLVVMVYGAFKGLRWAVAAVRRCLEKVRRSPDPSVDYPGSQGGSSDDQDLLDLNEMNPVGAGGHTPGRVDPLLDSVEEDEEEFSSPQDSPTIKRRFRPFVNPGFSPAPIPSPMVLSSASSSVGGPLNPRVTTFFCRQTEW